MKYPPPLANTPLCSPTRNPNAVPITSGSRCSGAGGVVRVNGPRVVSGQWCARASVARLPEPSAAAISTARCRATAFFFSMRAANSTRSRAWASGGTPAGTRESRRNT